MSEYFNPRRLDKKATTLEALGLSVRTCNTLHRNGIHTLKALLKLTEDDLSNLKGIGILSVGEILYSLSNHSLSIKQNPQKQKG